MTSPEHTSELDRLMEQEGRQLLEARMLPNEGPLTEAQRREVRAAVNAYVAKHGITQRDISRQVGGLNISSVSQLLKGTYKAKDATIDEHLRAINDWMEVDARRRQTRPDDRFVETHVAKRLLNCAMKASQMRTMALAHDPSGVGKSMVAHLDFCPFSRC